MAGGAGRDLYEFLVEAELQHYYDGLKNDLKVQHVGQLKYVEDEDLADMGLTKPEMRRLKKFFRKECPQGTFSKLKRTLSLSRHQEGYRRPMMIVKDSGTRESNGVTSATSSSTSTPQPGARHSSRYIIQEEALSILKTLGTGEFGTVQQGVWTAEDGARVQVAIKCVTPERMQAGRSDFLKEATVMHTIDHDHIVRLYGVVLGSDSLMLVTELAPLRSLLECLKDPSLRASFPVARLCDFALQICDGMAYLENKRFIHRDLAARNILVFAKDKVKISDFGLSRALGVGKDYYQTNFNVNLKLPIAWCAPECISYLKFTSASDVWAYGVTLWEMFTYGFQPWAGFQGQQPVHTNDWKYANQILEAIDEPSCQRLEKPDCCPSDIYQLMLRCWQHSPEDRPRFGDLLLLVSTLKPERVQATQDSSFLPGEKEYLHYRTSDVITVLDSFPEDAPDEGLGRGVLDSGKTGFYRKSETNTFIEVKTISSPMYKQKQTKLSRKESARRSQKTGTRKLDISMISGPANDLRHTGHIGYDGAVFGDVSFIGDSYNRLPVKVGNTKSNGSLSGSAASLPKSESDGDQLLSSAPAQPSPRLIQSFSALPSSSLTHSTTNGSSSSTIQNQEKEDTFDDLDTFKMPDMSMSDTFDLGPSLMDEVMKALTVTEPRGQAGSPSDALSDDKSPLLECEPDFPNGKTSFDNIAMSTDADSVENESVPNGSLGESGSSIDMMPGSRGSSIELQLQSSESTKKKKKPKLKIDGEEVEEDEFIPSGKSSRSGVRSLSESEEKKMDDAIKLANAYAAKSTSQDLSHPPSTPSPKSPESHSDHSHGESDCNSSMNSLKLRSVFRKKPKSPKQEKKSYTEEIASISDAAEVTPEAQEAYNMLIVRGSIKDKDSPPRRHSREARMNRSFEHQRQVSPVAGSAALAEKQQLPERPPVRNTRNQNLHIREPQGIPSRRISGPKEISEEVDVNPLRRLRESAAIIPPRSHAAKLPTDHRAAAPKVGPKTAPKPILSANTSFFDKLKEQERESQESSQDSQEGSEEGSINSIPLPPRTAARSSVSTSKPYERKYPLDLSNYNGHQNSHVSSSSSERSPNAFKSGTLPPDLGSENEVNDLNSTLDSEDSIFSECSQNSSLETSRAAQLNSYRLAPSPITNSSQFSVKSVKLSAKDLGYMDTSDLFWSKDVSLQELGSAPEQLFTDLGQTGHAPIPGRYKTSDTVSYEDLLEFALDGVSARECELDICDEVRLMRRVLTKDVTIEDCMYALEDTQWAVHSAIKLIKLKQLLSTNLADKERCKHVLLLCQWHVPEAADYLLRHSPGQDSPELVHV